MANVVTRADAHVNMIEAHKRLDGSGRLLDIAEVLTQNNPMIADALWLPATDRGLNKVGVRSKLPRGEWAQYYKGIHPDASQIDIQTFSMGRLKSRSVLDADLLDDVQNRDEQRRIESYAHLEGLSQQFSRALLYSNEDAEGGAFNGLAYYLDSLNLNNVVSATPVADLPATDEYRFTSIYLLKWSPQGIYCHYPRGNANAPAGISHESLPRKEVPDVDGNMYPAYVDNFQIHGGITIKDPRYMGRVANIDLDRLGSDPDYRFQIRWLIQAMQRTPNRGTGVIAYCSPEVHTEIIVNAIESNTYRTSDLPDVYGYYFESIYQFRLRSIDAISNHEAPVRAV